MRNQTPTPVSPTDLEPNFGDASMAKKALARLNPPCRVHVHSRRYRLTDADGVSAKAAIDGLVLSGLFADDKAEYITEVSYSQEKIPKTEIEETIITIIEASTNVLARCKCSGEGQCMGSGK
jgi:hypothetical protein